MPNIHKQRSFFLFLICFFSFLLGVVFTSASSLDFFREGIEKKLWAYGLIQRNDSGTFSGKTVDGLPVDTRLLKEAYEKVSENYYGFDTISEEDLLSGMIKGFVGSLEDKHSEYFNLEETKKFNEVLSGDFEWIGAVIEKNDFWVIVERIIAGSPAKEAGILAGDIITKANGEELKDLDLTDAVGKIRGPAETKVDLEIVRAGQKEILTKTVVRKKINIPSVDGKIIEGTKIGYIALSVFGEKTGDDFKKILDDLSTKKMDGLIIDLRDNGGGYLEMAVSILSNFVEKDKVLVTTKEKNPFLNRSYFSYGNNGKSMPIVVLVNENSASASEITAGALKDYNLAIIVGQKTYGKGSVQQPFTLSDGSELKVTVAKWYTPLDYGIDKVGINPDIEVKFEKEDFDKRYDRQLEEGKTILNEFILKKDRKTTIETYNAKKSEEKKLENTGTGAQK